jgi:serine/threonine protein kinase
MDRSVGPYKLGDSLGALPFGELVTATHAARSEPLAVLLLEDRLAKDYRFRGLVRLEVARAGSVRHPSIARAIEVGVHDDAPYVVVERPAEARTLARALSDADPPSREDALTLIRHLAEALDAAHSRRIVHGILDPTSILVTPGGGAALVGVALIGAVEEAGQLAVVAERADAAFTAPEQRTGRRAVASADGYALGVLAGELIRAQSSSDGPAEAVTRVLARQGEADPSARFSTCTAFATALAEAMSPLEATSPVAPAAPEQTEIGITSTTLAPLAARPTVRPMATPVGPLQAATVPPPSEPATSSEAPASARPMPGLPTGQHPPGSTAAEITEIPLTPAMADTLRPPPQRDLIGDAIRLVADRVPAIDDLLDRHAPDGTIGPVPLGIAAPGVLALLLILAGQAWLAAMLVVIAGVLYGLPRLGTALTASERANPRVVRVTGIVRLRRTPDLIGVGSPELVLGDGVSLNLWGIEYETLALFGQPIVIQRPAEVSAGVVDVVVAHDLPGATVTYLAPNLTLLDVRASDGTVLYRREPYRGEPGDRLGTPSDTPMARPDLRGNPEGPGQIGAATNSEHIVLPMPLAARSSIRTAANSEALKAGTMVVGVLIALVVFPRVVGELGFFLFLAFLALGIKGSPTVSRGISLWNARALTTMIRVVGPVVVTEHLVGSAHRYYVHLADGARIKVDGDAHRALAYAGEGRLTEARYLGSVRGRVGSEERLVSQHRIPDATATYTPGAALLLEVLDTSGGTIYREPVLNAGDLGSAGPPA